MCIRDSLEQRNENIKFQRIDADLTENFKEETEEDLKDLTETLAGVFKKALNKENMDVKVEKLKNDSISSMMTLSEESRRMQDMMKMYGMDASMFGNTQTTLVLNANHPLVKYVAEHKEDTENVPMICEQLYDLAMLAHTQLNPDEMTNFIARSNKIMMLLAK